MKIYALPTKRNENPVETHSIGDAQTLVNKWRKEGQIDSWIKIEGKLSHGKTEK